MFCKRVRRRLVSALLFVAALAAGCSKSVPPPAVRRIGVLPFENLSSKQELDWLAQAVPAVLEGQLTASRTTHVFAARSVNEAYGGGATQILHGYFSERPSGKLEFRAVLEDLGTNRDVLTADALTDEGRLLQAIDTLAKKLDAVARAYPTRSVQALREYSRGLAEADPKAAVTAMEQAVGVDPNFGPAYVALSQRWVAAGDPKRAEEVAEAAVVRPIPEIDRARLQFLLAGLRNDLQAREKALAALAASSPSDISLLVSVGQTEWNSRRYRSAADFFRKATAVNPSRADIWNSLGYAEAYGGNFDAAKRSLEKYRDLAPNDPNSLDSLGDLHLRFQQFKEAERYYQEAIAKNPRFQGGGPLFKAAEAMWMAGDLKTADDYARQYLATRRELGDPLAAYRAAQWDFMTGRRKKAITELTAALPALKKDAAALAHAELSLWLLDSSDRAAAARHAVAAWESAEAPQIRALAAIARFASLDVSSEELQAKLEQAFKEPAAAPIRKQAAAWALLYRRQFAEAGPLLRELETTANPEGAGRIAVLRAWASIEAGNARDAVPLLALAPIPSPEGEPAFAVIPMSRWFFLRGAALAASGKREQAQNNFRTYLQLADASAMSIDDRKQAKEALSR